MTTSAPSLTVKDLILKSDLESRSISATVITSVASALVLAAAICAFIQQDYWTGSISSLVTIMSIALAFMFARFCNCSVLIVKYAGAKLQNLNNKSTKEPTNNIMIIVLSLATVSCALALACAAWSAMNGNWVVAGLLAVTFVLLLTGSVIAGLWLSYTVSNLKWCLSNMSEKSLVSLVNIAIQYGLQLDSAQIASLLAST